MADKEVRFDKWCRTCKYRFRDEVKDPCNECLNEPRNDDSTCPIMYIKSKKEKSK